MEAAFTRRIEHKHLAPWERHERTVVDTEFSRETAPGDTPFYPKRLAADLARAEQYRAEARREERVSFLGRLATYRYLDMHQVIAEALDFAPRLAEAMREGKRRPVWPGE
jgi:UDP-galactopyranose mutase